MNAIRELKREVQPGQLLPSLTAGLIAAIVDISLEISLAALIFSGPLSQFLNRGIGLLLFGALVMGVVVSLAASLPGLIAVPQDTPAVILALVAAGIAASMKGADPQALYATVLAAMMLTSLLVAVFFILLGRFKASVFVRHIPYPVVGGFLAGTGWLLAKGALGVLVTVPLTLAGLPQLFSLNILIEWVPALIFAVALLWLLRHSKHFLITPGALFLATGLFYGYLFLAHISLAEASARGWMLGAFPGGALYQLPAPAAWMSINWMAILNESDQIATILVLSVVGLLLNATGLEITFGQDIDLDRELVTAGVANIAGGLGGSVVGYQALSLSTLAHRLGARTRLVNLVFALCCGAALVFGSSLISYFPKFVLGGLLLFLGLTFLVEWLVDARRALPAVDYLLVWIILAIIAAVGFLEGIGVGILIAAVIFVITYSRVNIVKNVLTGRTYHSNVDRPKAHRDLLAEHGAEVYILRLQGFIFFGTIETIRQSVRARMADKGQPRLGYLILDFQQVTHLDSSAVFGITRLKQLAVANRVWMVWTQVSPAMQRQLQQRGMVDDAGNSLVILPTLDHGMEWCENKILAEQGIADLTAVIERMERQFKSAIPGLKDVGCLMKYLERKEIPCGEYLMREGDPPTEMYFVEAGMVTAQLETPDGHVIRLHTIRGGATVGEMGLYLDSARTATVVATRPSVVYRLSAESLKRMCAEDPAVAMLLHEWIARLLAERLAASNRTIEALMN